MFIEILRQQTSEWLVIIGQCSISSQRIQYITALKVLVVCVDSQKKSKSDFCLLHVNQWDQSLRSAVTHDQKNNLLRFESVLTLAGDASLMVEEAIKVSSHVRIDSVNGRVVRDGFDHYYLIHSVGKDKVREPNMQNDRADRVCGIFQRR